MKKILYESRLSKIEDYNSWIPEGNVDLIDSSEGIILSNGDSETLGDQAHWTFWLNKKFPDNIEIEWEFKPIREPGLCMIFFCSIGKNGESIFDSTINERNGYYPQYHSGDINTYHISYFRHKYAEERAFRTCNMRKSAGFHMVAQGADPLPPTEDAFGFYQLKIKKLRENIDFWINDLLIFSYRDDGKKHGPVLQDGWIGFRQMAPMQAIYKNLRIYQLEETE